MAKNTSTIVVIGTSAGGLNALTELVSLLPADFSAPIFIVPHMGPETSAIPLLKALAKTTSLKCKQAKNGEVFKKGTIYLAQPDFHLLVKHNYLLVTKGARENHFRPAIDPLFRSAAVAYGQNVIGIVLTGMLDDGTAGLIAIKKCGGITIVQDPADAVYPEMPQSILNNMKVDYCVPIKEMGKLLDKLLHSPSRKSKPIPNDIVVEAKIAERVLSDVKEANSLGKQVPFNCPNCGGVLWEMKSAKIERYRCHTGHSFTDTTLLISQNEKIEETLWISLRMFEERKNLLTNMSVSLGQLKPKKYYTERIKESEIHIERIRKMLLKSEATTK